MGLWINSKHFGISSRGRVGARLGPVRVYAGGRRRRSSSSASGGSIIGITVALALIFGALVCIAAVPGHLLGLTPSVAQIFKSNPPAGYIHARYRNVALGFVLTTVLLVVAIAWLIALMKASRFPVRGTALAVLVIAAVAVVQTTTATGARTHLLSPAAAVGVALTPAQTSALKSVADKAVRGFGGSGDNLVDDIAYTRGWRTTPRRCRFANYSNGTILTSWNFTCVVDAVNRRVKRSTTFRVAVTCWKPKPSLRQCAADADTDVTDTRKPVG